VAGMKQILLMIALVALVGCGASGLKEKVDEQSVMMADLKNDIKELKSAIDKLKWLIAYYGYGGVDPSTGLPMGAGRGSALVDPSTGLPMGRGSALVDPRTGLPMGGASRGSSALVDPTTGLPMGGALELFTKAADQGHAQAQYNLGVMYENGQGVEQDFKEAVKWYQKAADQGLAYAQYNLGVMYEKGQGVEQDFKEAVKWYQKAADQGDAYAQYGLGFMYDNGKGVEQNNVTAYAWWNIAATNGDQDAKKGLPQVAKKMTPAQIAKGQKLSREMLNKNPKLLK
jgi:TPR repeat protein